MPKSDRNKDCDLVKQFFLTATSLPRHLDKYPAHRLDLTLHQLTLPKVEGYAATPCQLAYTVKSQPYSETEAAKARAINEVLVPNAIYHRKIHITTVPFKQSQTPTTSKPTPHPRKHWDKYPEWLLQLPWE